MLNRTTTLEMASAILTGAKTTFLISLALKAGATTSLI